MFIIKHKTIFFSIAAVLVVASLAFLFIFGLRTGIEFGGGTLIEVSYGESVPDKTAVESAVEASLPGLSSNIQQVGDNGYIVRTRFLTDEEQSLFTNALEGVSSDATIERISSIGPSVGSELAKKAIIAIVIVSIVTVLFIAYAFRKVSKPVSSWNYGFIAILTLLHDIIVPVGLFALLGHYLGWEVDVLFVMALLAILGYSINDTIVIFDRVRENLALNAEKKIQEEFPLVVGRSLKQTFARSFNTSFTTALVLIALVFFGAASTQHFALTLLTGTIAGTYSSLFLAAPLLVIFGNRTRKEE